VQPLQAVHLLLEITWAEGLEAVSEGLVAGDGDGSVLHAGDPFR
jgi:hypothetical protein